MARNQIMATAILSLWLGITFFMWFAAGRSFATVERVLQSQKPEFRKVIEASNAEKIREVLRYLASEINRTYFGAYGWTQVILGLTLLSLLFRQSPRDSFSLVFTSIMVLLVLVLALVITPQIVALGRSMDFVPRNPRPPQMGRFGLLHGLYTGLDGLKLLAGLTVLIRWIARG